MKTPFVSKGAGIALVLGALVAGALLGFFLRGRGPREVTTTSAVTSAAPPSSVRRVISVTPARANRIGLRVAAPEDRAIAPLVSVVGSVTFDPARVAALGTRIRGRVEKVRKFEGDVVTKGDVVADIESAELGEAQAAIGTARARARTAEANDAREQLLLGSHATSERDAQRASAAAVIARAELAAAEKRVQAMGGEPGGPVGVLRLRSPIDGKIVERTIAPGQSVDATFTAFRIADLRALWAELSVFERDLGAIRVGDPVDLSAQADPARVVPGRVAHVGDVIDRESRSAAVRVEIDNTQGVLRPGQAIVARIHTAKTQAARVVPLEAISTVDGKPIVFVAHDGGTFEPRTVETGARDADFVQILSGLAPDEQVAVAGVFALKSELFR